MREPICFISYDPKDMVIWGSAEGQENEGFRDSVAMIVLKSQLSARNFLEQAEQSPLMLGEDDNFYAQDVFDRIKTIPCTSRLFYELESCGGSMGGWWIRGDGVADLIKPPLHEQLDLPGGKPEEFKYSDGTESLPFEATLDGDLPNKSRDVK